METEKTKPKHISGAQIAAAVKAIYAKVKANFYNRTQSDERYQKKDGSNGTADGVSALMNKLTLGTSDPQDDDYYICQYVNGGDKTTTYHRRKTSSLWNYLKKKTDALYLGKTATAEKAKSATYVREDSPRKGSANINFSNDAGLHHFLVDVNTTKGKPPYDAHIIHCEWDNNNSWAAQFAMPCSSKTGQRPYLRYQRGQTWTDWEGVALVSDLNDVPKIDETGMLEVKGLKFSEPSAEISAPGWYRVFESNYISGSVGNNVMLRLSTSYVYNKNESYVLSISSYWGCPKVCITQLSGVSPGRVISKIRVVTGGDGKKLFIDIYYAKSQKNLVAASGLGGNFQAPTATDTEIGSGYQVTEFELGPGLRTNMPSGIDADTLDGKYASDFVAKTPLTPNTYHCILEGVEISAGFVTNPEGALRIYGASFNNILRAGDVITYGMESEGYDGVAGNTYRAVMLDARRFIIYAGAFLPYLCVVQLGIPSRNGDDLVYQITGMYSIDMEELM